MNEDLTSPECFEFHIVIVKVVNFQTDSKEKYLVAVSDQTYRWNHEVLISVQSNYQYLATRGSEELKVKRSSQLTQFCDLVIISTEKPKVHFAVISVCVKETVILTYTNKH